LFYQVIKQRDSLDLILNELKRTQTGEPDSLLADKELPETTAGQLSKSLDLEEHNLL